MTNDNKQLLDNLDKALNSINEKSNRLLSVKEILAIRLTEELIKDHFGEYCPENISIEKWVNKLNVKIIELQEEKNLEYGQKISDDDIFSLA